MIDRQHVDPVLRIPLSAAVAIVLASACAGCGDGRPERVPISGRVLIDGAPLNSAFVKFVPPTGRPSMGKTDAEGRFSLQCYDGKDGATRGTHQIAITAVTEISSAAIKWRAPKKYADVRSSGLEVAVDRPQDDVEIRITWDGRKPFIERFGNGAGD